MYSETSVFRTELVSEGNSWTKKFEQFLNQQFSEILFVKQTKRYPKKKTLLSMVIYGNTFYKFVSWQKIINNIYKCYFRERFLNVVKYVEH